MQWWANMWDAVAQFFGYDLWQWGTTAEWFGALGTILALFWALKLFRDEREQRQRIEADAFYAFADIGWIMSMERRTGSSDFGYVHITLRNNGTTDIHVQTIYIFENEEVRVFRAGPLDDRMLPPRKALRLEYTDRPIDSKFEVYVAFRDSGGRRWLRDARKNRLVEAREHDKLLPKLGGRVLPPLPAPREENIATAVFERVMSVPLFASMERRRVRKQDDKIARGRQKREEYRAPTTDTPRPLA
ncbi:hypothetical protein [Microbacterium oxydans]|uniref:hypothetical protein n=1 Tax=Microbacterium oxydans TaxID=82380 RepID=UPI0012E01EC5|nr:hypothetical protein [Microbacterium oxydans]